MHLGQGNVCVGLKGILELAVEYRSVENCVAVSSRRERNNECLVAAIDLTKEAGKENTVVSYSDRKGATHSVRLGLFSELRVQPPMRQQLPLSVSPSLSLLLTERKVCLGSIEKPGPRAETTGKSSEKAAGPELTWFEFSAVWRAIEMQRGAIATA